MRRRKAKQGEGRVKDRGARDEADCTEEGAMDRSMEHLQVDDSFDEDALARLGLGR